MDKKLQIVLHLYGEADDRAAFRRLLEDEEVRAEHQAMSEAKFALDHARPKRPDPALLARIMEAAAHPERLADAPAPGRDRRPVRLLRRRRWQWVAAAAVALVAVSVGVGRMFAPESSRLASEAPPALREHAEGFGTNAQPQTIPAQTADVLDWDDADEVRRLHRRMEQLRARNAELQWGEPAVPLETLPTAVPGVRLRQAGSRPPGQ